MQTNTTSSPVKYLHGCMRSYIDESYLNNFTYGFTSSTTTKLSCNPTEILIFKSYVDLTIGLFDKNATIAEP